MKALYAMALLAIYTNSAHSQQAAPISLNLYGGYTFPDHASLGYYNNYQEYGYIEGAGQYGVGLEFFVNKLRSVELSYLRMSTHAQFYDWEGQTNPNNDKADLNYIMIGGNNYLPTRTNLLPYVGASIGVGIADFNYYDGGSSTITKFAWNLRLGVKVQTQSAVSIKLQAYLQSIVQGVGVGFGTGGAGAGVTTYSTMLQFGLGAGLCFALGGNGSGHTPNNY